MATTKPKLVSKMPNVLESMDDLKALIDASPADKRIHGFFSPRLQKELIINQPAEYQRRIDRGYVDLYRRAMAANPSKWRHHQADNVMIFDTKYQMMVGHHRCVAGIEGNATFGAWIIGKQPAGEAKYLDQIRSRTPGQTIEMFGHQNASNIAGVAKMFVFSTLNESPLASGRISPDEANDMLHALPEIQEWYLQARRIKHHHVNSTPSVPWLTYIIGRMFIEDQELAEKFVDALEPIQDGRASTKMSQILLALWNSKTSRNTLAMKIWYHNTAAKAWEAFVNGEVRERLVSPKDRLLDWASPPKDRS